MRLPLKSLRPLLLAALLLCAPALAPLPAFAQAQQAAAPATAPKPGTPVPAGSPLQAGPVHAQFAIYYAPRPKADPMAALRSRLAKLGDAPKLLASLPKPSEVAAPVLFANWNTTTVQQTYRAPEMEMLQRFGHGITREQAEALQGSSQALIIDFAHPSKLALPAMRKALELTLQVARDTNGFVWDEETRELFTPDEWQKRRVDPWAGGIPDIASQIVIHAYQADNKLARAITLGMGKFGLPDVVVSQFSWSMNGPMGTLVNGFAQAMVEGAQIARPGQFDLDLRTLKQGGLRDPKDKEAKGTTPARLSLVAGTWESGDPRNRLYEIGFDRYPGPDRSAQQVALLKSTFGAADDSVSRIKHNEEILAASKLARAQLPALRDAFAKGLAPGEYILVKAPFVTRSGGNEWMWVEVTGWKGDAIDGMLKNEPVEVADLHAGQMVKVSQAKVFDYMRRYADGREEGNETGKVIQRGVAGKR